MKSIYDVAEHAGVSSATVSRYVNNSGYVGKAARERIAHAIAELDYIPNRLARSLHSKSTQTIGLLLPDIMNVFWTGVARGVEDEARKNGFNVILCNTDSDDEKLEDDVSVLLQRQVDGIVYVPISGMKTDPLTLFQPIQKNNTPAVVLDIPLDGARSDTILVDSQTGACQLTELLIGLGHRRIAIITGDKGYYTSEKRLAGFKDALKKAGIQPERSLIRYVPFDMEHGRRAANDLLALPQPPTAFFAANNMIALGIVQAVRNAGLRIPEDFSLVCFDDIPQASLIDPFLTVAAQPAYEIGQTAARLLVERIQGTAPAEPRTVILPVEIIQRRSCMPINPAAATALSVTPLSTGRR